MCQKSLRTPGLVCPCRWFRGAMTQIAEQLLSENKVCLHERCIIPKRLTVPTASVQCPECREFVPVDDLRVTIPPLPKRKP